MQYVKQIFCPIAKMEVHAKCSVIVGEHSYKSDFLLRSCLKYDNLLGH